MQHGKSPIDPAVEEMLDLDDRLEMLALALGKRAGTEPGMAVRLIEQHLPADVAPVLAPAPAAGERSQLQPRRRLCDLPPCRVGDVRDCGDRAARSAPRSVPKGVEDRRSGGEIAEEIVAAAAVD